MAEALVALHVVAARALTDATMPLASDAAVDREILTPGAAAQSTVAAPASALSSRVWLIRAIGGDIKVKFGVDPTVAADDYDAYVSDGETLQRAATAGGKVSVMAVS